MRYVIEYRDRSTTTTIEADEMSTVLRESGVTIVLPVIRFIGENRSLVAMVPLDVVRCVTVEAPALVGA